MPLDNNQELYFHQVTDDTVLLVMRDMRKRYIDLALHIEAACARNRARSIALTHLEESLQRTIQSLAMTHGTKELPE